MARLASKGYPSQSVQQFVTAYPGQPFEPRSKVGMAVMMVLFRTAFAKEFEGSLDRWQKAIEAAG